MSKQTDSRFICPICKRTLFISGGSYKCENSHCFDISRSGYVNLLTSDHMNARSPGDNKLMVRARTEFLGKGYYSGLLDALIKTVSELDLSDILLLDAGCGEGYYTGGITAALRESGRNISSVGVDISKFALDSAAKRHKGIEFAVGSVFRLPSADSSCNLLLNIFSPFCREEFFRVLVPRGRMIMVIPGKKHLWELKRTVYDKPYENEMKNTDIEGFELEKSLSVSFNMDLQSSEDIAALFSMTPYFYKTSEKDKSKLSSLCALETRAEFEILVYLKST